MREPAGRDVLAAVVLAAGGSTRMGRPKQLLPLGGVCLLQRVIDVVAAAALGEIVVVLGYRAAEIAAALTLPRGARTVVNPDWHAGQSTSLLSGVRACSAAAGGAAVFLGDQPGIVPADVTALVETFRAVRAPVVRPVHARGATRVPGHPVLLARAIWPALGALRGDEGARALLAAHPTWLHAVEVPGSPAADVDTWADYARLTTVGAPRAEAP